MRPTLQRTSSRDRRNRRIALFVIIAMVLAVGAPVLFFLFTA